MSEEKYFCEYCGYNSTTREQCSHCGRAIENLFTERPLLRLPAWGRLTVRAYEPDKAEALWQDLSVIWTDLEAGLEQWLDSQMEKFKTATDKVELYCSSWYGSRIKELLGNRVTIEFQELPDDQIPFLPVPPRPAHWRQPYVPRSKRKDTL